MTSRFAALLSSALVVGATMASLAPTGAMAGQFKTLNTQGLAPGGQVGVFSSPKNTSSAMEMEVYEWPSPASGTYNCGIALNSTGQVLRVNMIGLTGVSIGSCTTVAGGTCSTSSVSLGGGFKFMCTVASGAGFPISSDGSWYQIAVRRAS